MKIPENVIPVAGYKCAHPGCTARLFAHPTSAARHAKKCINNPLQRTCASCEHDARLRDGGGPGCDEGVRENGVRILRYCIRWKQREIDPGY